MRFLLPRHSNSSFGKLGAARKRRLLHERLENRHLLAVITVDTTIDENDGSILDGDISLRDALAQSGTGDTIEFDPSLDGETILLSLGQLEIDRSLTIDGTALNRGVTIDASGNDPTPDENNGDGSRVFLVNDRNVDSESRVTLAGLGITGGDAGSGGGVSSFEVLQIHSSHIYDNSADSGGGIWSLGGADVPLRVVDTQVVGNVALGGHGGGISIGGGGHFCSNSGGSHYISDSTITGNTARSGGGVWAINYSYLDILRTTISDNVATEDGGGLATKLSGKRGRVVSSSITGNSADSGGGIHLSEITGRFELVNSTISGNSAASRASGIYSDVGEVAILGSTIVDNQGGGAIWGDILEVNDSILARNTSSNGVLSNASWFWAPSGTNNLIGSDVTINGEGNIVSDTPLLGPLRNHGGPTQTHALLPESPAIDMGSEPIDPILGYDQRGIPFSRVAGKQTDIGAFEYQIAPIDFDANGQLDCADVNVLSNAIASSTHAAEFDLTGDREVDRNDLDVWFVVAGLENLPSHRPLPQGDANLDGRVDAADLNTVKINWRTMTNGFCNGDFNADGRVNAADLNVLASNWRLDAANECAQTVVQREPRAVSNIAQFERRLARTSPHTDRTTNLEVPTRHSQRQQQNLYQRRSTRHRIAPLIDSVMKEWETIESYSRAVPYYPGSRG